MVHSGFVQGVCTKPEEMEEIMKTTKQIAAEAGVRPSSILAQVFRVGHWRGQKPAAKVGRVWMWDLEQVPPPLIGRRKKEQDDAS